MNATESAPNRPENTVKRKRLTPDQLRALPPDQLFQREQMLSTAHASLLAGSERAPLQPSGSEDSVADDISAELDDIEAIRAERLSN